MEKCKASDGMFLWLGPKYLQCFDVSLVRTYLLDDPPRLEAPFSQVYFGYDRLRGQRMMR